jgi:ketosteroid isomerase-like protein
LEHSGLRDSFGHKAMTWTPVRAQADAVGDARSSREARTRSSGLATRDPWGLSDYAACVSEQNVELHRRVLDAFNSRDIEAMIECSDPSFEYYPLLSAIGVTVYHGHEGLRSWFEQLDDAWEELRAEPEAYFDLGEQTLLFYVVRGRGRHSGAEVAVPGAQVCRWRDGLGVYAKQYAHREDALRDLGVSEDALEPIAP